MQLYPDWSSRANATRGKKRKRKQDPQDGGSHPTFTYFYSRYYFHINTYFSVIQCVKIVRVAGVIVSCEPSFILYCYLILHLYIACYFWGKSVGRPGPILLKQMQTFFYYNLESAYARLSETCMS